MVAYAFFVGLLVAAAALGYFVYKSYSASHKLRSILIAFAAAILVLGLSGAVFLYAFLSYPANDDPRFAGRNNIYIDREDKVSGAAKPRRSAVRVVFPYSVRKDSDFEVRLILSADPPLAAGDYTSELQGPYSLKLRPQRSCASPPSNSGVACKSIKDPRDEIALTWDVTPTAEAEAILRLTIPAIWSDSLDWSASIEFDGYAPLVEGREEVLDARRPQFRLTESTRFAFDYDRRMREKGELFQLPYARAGAEIDLDTRQVRFPIMVSTSLGLDSATYGKLALLGTILSGFLGTGWAWKLYELIRPARTR
jgi:hypothetical protein